MRRARALSGAAVPAFALLAGGCVQRTISITSDPPGALVWLNDREVGRTPVDVEFVHYGTYDVRIRLDGYEPLLTTGRADPPWWDLPGPDFAAELLPGELRSEVAWHYVLEPRDDDPAALVDRARAIRRKAREDAPEAVPGP